MSTTRVDLRGNLPALTGLRAFAALWVLVYHAWVESGPQPLGFTIGATFVRLTDLVSTGWAGVDVFFTLSAFLLTLPFLLANDARQPSLATYFKRRALRILPAYYAQLALVLALLAWTGRFPGWHVVPPHLVLWLNLGSPPVAPVLGVWWTLPIEFSFYFLLPIVVRGLTTPKRAVLVGIAAIAVTVSYRLLMFAIAQDLPVGNRVLLLEQMPGRLDQFVIGMLAAYAAVRLVATRAEPDPRRATLWFAAGSVGLLACIYAIGTYAAEYWDGHPLLFTWHTLVSVAIAAMILGATFAGPALKRLLANRFLVWTGTVSYSLYLWHQWLIQKLHPLLFADYAGYSFPLFLPIALVASLAVASVSYRLVERPFLRTGRSAQT